MVKGPSVSSKSWRFILICAGVHRVPEKMNLESHFTRCNAILSSIHEACDPYYTAEQRQRFGLEGDYGGITGTILPSHMMRFAKVLLGDTSYRLEAGKSIFCDIGCGTGRPTFYFGGLEFRCALGFDVSSAQVNNSITGHKKLRRRVRLACPVSFFKHDVCKLDSLDPVTHAYAFMGYLDFAINIARVVANSKDLKVLLAVFLKKSDLRESGLWEEEDEDVIFLPGMKMAGGRSYIGVVLPITDERRMRARGRVTLSESKVDLSGHVQDAIDGVARMEVSHERLKRRCTQKFHL